MVHVSIFTNYVQFPRTRKFFYHLFETFRSMLNNSAFKREKNGNDWKLGLKTQVRNLVLSRLFGRFYPRLRIIVNPTNVSRRGRWGHPRAIPCTSSLGQFIVDAAGRGIKTSRVSMWTRLCNSCISSASWSSNSSSSQTNIRVYNTRCSGTHFGQTKLYHRPASVRRCVNSDKWIYMNFDREATLSHYGPERKIKLDVWPRRVQEGFVGLEIVNVVYPDASLACSLLPPSASPQIQKYHRYPCRDFRSMAIYVSSGLSRI